MMKKMPEQNLLDWGQESKGVKIIKYYHHFLHDWVLPEKGNSFNNPGLHSYTVSDDPFLHDMAVLHWSQFIFDIWIMNKDH